MSLTSIYLVLDLESVPIYEEGPNGKAPAGFDLFVVRSLTGANIVEFASAALRLFILCIVMVIPVTVFPEIVMFLLRMMTHG